MSDYIITGMSCAACSARVEKAVKKLDDVKSCSVNLLTNSMRVEGGVLPEVVIAAVEKAGYGAKLKDEVKNSADKNIDKDIDLLEDKDTPLLKRRLIFSLGFLVVLMYFSMGHMMWGWPLPKFFDNNHVAMGLVQLILAAIIMIINQKFFISGFKSLWHLAPNMDTLVAMGAMASFAWSVVVLFLMTRAQADGDSKAVMDYMMQFYFESAGMILTLITVGKMLEARSKGKTTNALKSLMKLAPKTAVIIKNNLEVEVKIENVKKGDIFIVKPGGSVPVDGIIIEGETAINEAALTGESIPVDKAVGDMVSAATINQSGFIKCEAVRVGEDTALAQIIKMVSDASAGKAPVAKIADKVCGIFVPAVILIAFIVVIAWLLAGKNFGEALAYGIAVLVISCPCALGLATPVAVMVGSGVGARHGILFKTAEALEQAGKVKIAALDKTGTITSGEPKVTDVIANNNININEEDLVRYAAALEAKSEHPLAKAVMKFAENKNINALEVKDFKALPGNGLEAVCDDKKLLAGSLKFISENLELDNEIKSRAEDLAEQGKTPLLFAKGGELLGIIAVADTIKPDSKEAIKELKDLNIKVVMLTGDNERTARAIGNEAGVDEVIAGVLPDGKDTVIKDLKVQGKVAMVGDGINDAPALTSADTGFAIGAGADVAIDAADVVLVKSSLKDVASAIRLSRKTLSNIHENLFWAFIYNVIGIPLAAGLWGFSLDPMFGAAAMSLSSFCVVSNALRLNLAKI
ncbi:MAG: copper-translocating P-type ATPase [Synergistaceae bacterium]|nr:copper-translocating P-type ATPase [Synergistaceae bacterium]